MKSFAALHLVALALHFAASAAFGQNVDAVRLRDLRENARRGTLTPAEQVELDAATKARTGVRTTTSPASPHEAIREQLGRGLDLVIHLARLSDGSRRVVEVGEVVRTAGSVGVRGLFRLGSEAGGRQWAQRP